MNELIVRGDSLPEAYHQALRYLNYCGEMVDCRAWNTRQLECSMTILVKEPFKEPMISKFFIGGTRELQEYVMEMLDGIKDFEIEKGNWVYTYHDRYVKQVPFIIDELKKDPSSRRAVMMIRDESDIGSDDPACWQHVQYFIRDNKLHCKALFRSNDACKAIFMNMFAIIMIQKRISDTLGIEIGTYTHRANSFHCYEKDIPMLEGYCKRIESAKDEDDVAFYYDDEDGWKPEMESFIPQILADVEELKKR